ncbi:CHASE2 domain-containing protein [Phormidium sp. CCY1219]|uniref:CHASE2 domain-containing protein n=1 Tax=Phormidium sp. CCY1219 TaxID=2886104 RepID=UPI002D1E6868|nr:CHASE2 domain-containing protein [Phormidium sp. CCY1219]MEB3827923.1 CHASE2 domain-containing protein [Phormidium sp. CCY1219]
MWKKLKHQLVGEWRFIWFAASCVAVGIIALRWTGALQLLEWSALDLFFRMRPLEPKEDRIVIVGVSESDLQQLGQWPISDAIIAELLEKLKQQQPRGIGLDIYRDLSVREVNSSLVQVFETTPNLIGVTLVGGDENQGVEPNPVLSELGQVGAIDMILDADGKIRRGLLFVENQAGEILPTLSLRLALLYLEKEGVMPKNAAVNSDYMQLNEAVFVRMKPNDGGYIRTSNRGYQILMNFKKLRNSFEIVSLMDVLENRISPDFARDRVVLIGSTASSLQDYWKTPYDPWDFITDRVKR